MRFGTTRHWRALKAMLEAQGYRCAYTGEPLILGVNDSLDHIHPISRFPEHAADPVNTEWVCRAINQMKRDRTAEAFLTLLRQILAYRSSRQAVTWPVGASVA